MARQGKYDRGARVSTEYTVSGIPIAPERKSVNDSEKIQVFVIVRTSCDRI